MKKGKDKIETRKPKKEQGFGGVQPNVMCHSLHVMKMFKFTLMDMILNHGVEYTFFEYND